MSTQETEGTRAWPAAGGQRMLASDADRDAAAGLLNAALAEGRLTADEYDQRLSTAYAARTWQQLGQVTADLPAPSAAAVGQAARGVFAGADLCLACVLLVACPPANTPRAACPTAAADGAGRSAVTWPSCCQVRAA